MIQLFHETCSLCSKLTTEMYSTSFSSAIRLLHKDLRKPIYQVYGFVRFADEIVDSFHGYNKEELLLEFERETYLAIERGISLNPVLHSFQQAVNRYNIEKSLIDAFFKSMKMDLNRTRYDSVGYDEYIYGSAEVVGLMCLYIFCEGDAIQYEKLRPAAQALGAAFQKVNFMRDLKSDFKELSRTYFPQVDFNHFTPSIKKEIEEDISVDFEKAYHGILHLPVKARFGVYVAYKYYMSLFRKIRNTQPAVILNNRIRIPDYKKFAILLRAGMRTQLNML